MSSGLDLANLSAWIADSGLRLSTPCRAELIQGGHSNLTYLVDHADGERTVLRRPPLHGVIESAHDVLREHRIMSALEASAVPVPRMLGSCEAAEMPDAPFFLMSFVEGLVLRSMDEAQTQLTKSQRTEVGQSLVDVLACLHGVDLKAVGLDELGRRDEYVARQLHRWRRQHDDTRTRQVPLVESLHEQMARAVPPQQGETLVHGDFRLDNVLAATDGTVRAVLDWELCTLGDPMADLGNTLAYWLEPGEEPYELLADPTLAAGFPDRTSVVARYVELTGYDASDIAYYEALGCWKVAIILEGVYARYRSGAMGDRDHDPDGLLRSSDRLLHRAQQRLREVV